MLAEKCKYCTGAINALSTGGPDVCCLCEVYGVPPNVYMGWRKAWDFHASKRDASKNDLSGSLPLFLKSPSLLEEVPDHTYHTLSDTIT